MDLQVDLFICVGEMSGDLHGARLIQELLALRPSLKIGAVAGPNMRKLPIQEFFPMEDLCVMGFIDVLWALPKIIRSFFSIRKKILTLRPKAVVLIDYPGFHLRLEKSLRKQGYFGKLIHFICPTVWAWGKKRIPLMAEHLDLLLTIFPFEKECFTHTELPVLYIGHPLVKEISKFERTYKFKEKMQEKILGIFPGSRKKEIERNLPLQLKVARQLQKMDPSLKIFISQTQFELSIPDAVIVPFQDHYELMQSSHVAIATSGTVTLELALHQIPTVVTFAINSFDCFLAQKIFKIHLPFYAMPNIIVKEMVFPELFGPHFTEENLFFWAQRLWNDETAREQCLQGCKKIQKSLGFKEASQEAAKAIVSSVDF